MRLTAVQQKEDTTQFEQRLIAHCSPVLAGLKSANLMNLTVHMPEQFFAMIAAYHCQLCSKGVSITLLRYTGRRALVYVYRERKLLSELQKPGVADFLREQGYSSMELPELLAHLRTRIQSQAEFPHEIGLFLGYPLHDVIGFIKNEGQNSCCTGCWKVYDCVCDAKKLFQKFERCRTIYMQLFQQGKPIMQLTVAA